MEERAKGGITQFGANLLYLISMVLFISVGYVTQKWSFHYGILITEFLLIALPAVIYIKTSGESIKKVLRFNRLGFVDMLLVILIFITGYFVATFFHLLWQAFLSLFGQLMVPDIPVAENWNEYIVLLLIIAGSAGLCEELLFRGLLMTAYKRLGEWPRIFFTAVLFSILHLNIQNFVAPLFLGILLGFVVSKTNSILAGMLGHFLNNAISVTVGFVITSMPFYKPMGPEEIQTGLQTAPLLGAAIFVGIFALILGTVMILCMKVLADRHNMNVEELEERQSISSVLKDVKSAWPLYAGMVVFAGMLLLQVLYIIQGKTLIQ